jgi:hypothetical protein
MSVEAIIWTEGKTDWQHLKCAFQALGVGSRIGFHESDADLGDDQLLKQCSALARTPQAQPTIFIFDRDKDEIITKVQTPSSNYRMWGNNVYSFAIPIPPHRSNQSSICIEFYYTDEELRSVDQAGRRLFLSNEFNPSSGRHSTNQRLSVGNNKKLPAPGTAAVRLLDSDVYDELSRNVALSKSDFAQNVLKGTGAFGSFRFDSFREILSVVDNIIEQARERVDLPFGDLEGFLTYVGKLELPHQLGAVVEAAIRVWKLAALTFGAATFRYYERRIVAEAAVDIKKVRPLKKLLAESFGQPSLATLHKLARYSHYLIDDHAPSSICSLRAMMAANPVLGPVGELIDRLESALPAARHGRIVNKSQVRKPILEYLLPELAKFEGRTAEIVENATGTEALRDIDGNTWRAVLSALVEMFATLRSLSFGIRQIQRVRSNTDEFDILLTTYRDGRKATKELTHKYEDLSDDRFESYELLPSDGEGGSPLDLFPFLTIKDDRLYYYNRTRAQGYEYGFALGNTGHVIPTKRKFSHVALREMISADLQGLFWTQVTPSVSNSGVKATIPTHEPIVGRKQQIATIMEEVIEIINQNGIIYGPGGVGKTALLVELSRQLFDAPPDKYFKNIIWVTAKRDLYDPTLDAVEAHSPQFRSLDNVLTAILEFHGFEDASVYDLDDKKWLVLESLRDESTLLILDNFESVARALQEDIRGFFGVEAKKGLKDRPNHLKVLITSRELIPSGFHQIKLRGLDKRESKELMQRLDQQYALSGHEPLTGEQRDAIYDATRGIPLIIKHCYGQMYEYNQSPDQVLKTLSNAGTKVVDFSFSELFQSLKQDDLQLRTILLLELIGRPLIPRGHPKPANEGHLKTGQRE